MKWVTAFTVTGTIHAVTLPKFVEIVHEGSLLRVKLAKGLRPVLLEMQPGQWIRLHGQQQVKLEGQEKQIRYKATDVMLLQDDPHRDPAPMPPPAPTLPKVIHVCTKGSCRKQGSLDLIQSLSAQCPQGIEIVPTGCLKNCKAGPTVCVGSHHLLSRATPEAVWSRISR